MRYLWLVVLWGCTEATAKVPESPGAPSITLQVAGDTAKGFFHWTAGRNATEYLVTVTASNSGWVGLPVNVSSRGLSGSFLATHSTADSADFTVCIRSFNSSGVSTPVCSVPKRWRRSPGAPGVPVWDSLTVAYTLYIAASCKRNDSAKITDSLYCPPDGPFKSIPDLPSVYNVGYDSATHNWVILVSTGGKRCPTTPALRIRRGLAKAWCNWYPA